jgi:hypothetical protein
VENVQENKGELPMTYLIRGDYLDKRVNVYLDADNMALGVVLNPFAPPINMESMENTYLIYTINRIPMSTLSKTKALEHIGKKFSKSYIAMLGVMENNELL